MRIFGFFYKMFIVWVLALCVVSIYNISVEGTLPSPWMVVVISLVCIIELIQRFIITLIIEYDFKRCK